MAQPPSDLISETKNQPPSDLLSPPSDLQKPKTTEFAPAPALESEGIMKKAEPYIKGTAAAGTLGALTPEILTGTGIAAGTFPLTAPAAPFLLSAGQLARGTRLGLGLAGGGGYLGGQALKAVTPQPEKPLIEVPGGRLTRGEAAEFGGELLTPLAYKIPAAILSKAPAVRSLLYLAREKGAPTAGTEAATRELSNLRNRVPINQLLNTERLRVSPNDVASYRRVFDKLQTADADAQARITSELANAEAKAQSVLQQYSTLAENALKTNQATAKRLIDEGDRKAQQIINDAIAEADRKLGVRQRALRAGGVAEQTSSETLGRIGNVNRFESDIGSSIQQRIKNVVSEEQRNLNKAYNDDKRKAFDEVNRLESAGQGVAQTPSYKNITDYLDRLLNKGDYKKEPFVRTIEPTLKASLKSLRKSLGGIKEGVDKTGTAIEVRTPVSFKGVDEVRQKLGDVYAGKEVEGFKNISKEQAKELYKLIRAAQVEYAGGKDGVFDMLLRNYSEGKDLLNALKIPPGKKIIKTDLINPEYMTYDPSRLAGEFFVSEKSVRDLVNLTKDAAFVEQAASDHVARKLIDKDAKAVTKFLRENDEWLQLMPNLRARVQNHLAALSRTESIGAKTGKLAETLKTEMKALPITGQKEADTVRKEAAKAAKEAETTGKKEAKRIAKEGQVAAKETKDALTAGVPEFEPLVGKGDITTQIRKLITEGNTEKLRRAAPIIKSDRNVFKAFQDAVKLEISQLSPERVAGTAQLRGEWQSKIRPALLETGLIDEAFAKQIDTRMKTAQLAMQPNEAVQTMLYILRQAAAGSVGETMQPAQSR